MTKIQKLTEIAVSEEQTAVTINNHDSALIGYCSFKGQLHAVYSKEKIIRNLVKKGMTREEAMEYYDFNMDFLTWYDDGPIVFDKL